jgi:Transglycosylase SLT domain
VKSLRSLARFVSVLAAMAFMGQSLCVHATTTESPACWQAVEARYGISAQLLAGIAQVESGLRPAAVNSSHKLKTNSIDIGLTQINSRWLPKLSTFGITQQDLFDACTNLHVGGWILSDLLKKHGNTWDAVGAYNAACTQLKGNDCLAARSTYAWKVYRAMVKLNPSQLALQANSPAQTAQTFPLEKPSRISRTSRIASLSFKEKRLFTQATEGGETDVEARDDLEPPEPIAAGLRSLPTSVGQLAASDEDGE